MRLLGHPGHPMLVIFPAGMFIMIVAGVIGGLIAASFGFTDWMQLPGIRALGNTGQVHNLAVNKRAGTGSKLLHRGFEGP